MIKTTAKVISRQPIFEIDQIANETTTTMTLSMAEAAALRDQLLSFFRKLEKSHGIPKPGVKSYILKQHKNNPNHIMIK